MLEFLLRLHPPVGSGCSSPKPIQGERDAKVFAWDLDHTQGNTCCTASITSSEQRIGVATHLSTLVTRLDAPAKSCSI